MSQFYDLASLVVIPSGYKASTIYAQKPLTTDGQLSFSRASTATRVNASGLIEAVASNVPRLDYLGSTCPRLLLEPQRTNYQLYSENSAQWISPADGITVAYNTTETLDPSGYYGAEKVTAVSGNKRMYDALTNPSGAFTMSAFVKAGTGDVFLMRTTSASVLIEFNLTTLAITAAAGTGTITSYGNGWYRCTASTTSAIAFEVVQYQFLNDANEYMYFFGAQAENGAYATSYVPTTSASVTRVADTYQKAGFGNTSTAGTLYYEFSNYNSPAAANGFYMVILFAGSSVTSTDFSPSNAISIINNGLAIEGRNNSYATTLFSFTPTAGATVKVALRYDGTNVVSFVNGTKGTVFTDTSVGVKNALRVNNGENATHASKELLFFPTALTDAQCIELTTL
jgi:hypothetical protein